MDDEYGTYGQLPIDADLAPDDPGEPAPHHQPVRPPVRRSRDHLTLAAIAAGGFIGTLARYLAGQQWRTEPGTFPFTTFAINTSGAFMLGLVLTTLLERFPAAHHTRPFVCTGVIGGWTTMSTLAFEVVLLTDGSLATAVVYATATLVGGVAAGSVGVGAAHRIPRRLA